jgi:hypothetical protein
MANTFNKSCPTRTTLQAAWLNAMDVYSRAVAEQSQLIGMVSRAEFERLSRAAEAARQQLQEVKGILRAHTSTHGCIRDGEAAA